MGAGRTEVIEKQCRPLLTDQQKEEGRIGRAGRFCTGDSAVQSEMAWHASQQYDTQSNPRSLARWECHLVLVFCAPRDPIPSLQCGQVNGISGRELRGAAWFEEASH